MKKRKKCDWYSNPVRQDGTSRRPQNVFAKLDAVVNLMKQESYKIRRVVQNRKLLKLKLSTCKLLIFVAYDRVRLDFAKQWVNEKCTFDLTFEFAEVGLGHVAVTPQELSSGQVDAIEGRVGRGPDELKLRGRQISSAVGK